jgi:hypothetical protein
MAEQTTIKCTDDCGFSVTGTEEFCLERYKNHHHAIGEYETDSWVDWFLDNWLRVVLVLIVIALVVIPLFKDAILH